MLLILIFSILSLWLGSVPMHLNDFLFWLSGGASSATHALILNQYRLPGLIVSLIAGAALSISGLLLQSFFRNPLAGPSVLGISSGAGMGVAIFILFLTNQNTYSGWVSVLSATTASLMGALMVLLILMVLASRVQSNTALLIAGVMVAYGTSAVSSILKFQSSKEHLQSYVIWGLGSFQKVSWDQIPYFAALVLLGCIPLLFMIKAMNAWLFGETFARNAGVRLGLTRILLVTTAGYLAAIVTAFTGPVIFIGLAAPHLARGWFKSSRHEVLIPASVLFGMLLGLLAGWLARLPGSSASLPLNAVTAIIGIPVVLVLLLRNKKLGAV